MSIEKIVPVMDIHPWPDGLGFKGGKEWWLYVTSQNEEDKIDILITTAYLSETVCMLLLTHDQELFAKFQLSPQTIARLCMIHTDSLQSFVAKIIEQDKSLRSRPRDFRSNME